MQQALVRSYSHGSNALWSSDELMVLDREGDLTETYWTYSYSTLRDSEDSQSIAVICPVADTTSSVISSRQLNTLKDITAHAADANTTREACSIVISAISLNTYDFPFAMIYTIDRDRSRLSMADSCGVDSLNDPFYTPEIPIPDERGSRISFDYRFPVQQALYSSVILVATTGKSAVFDLSSFSLNACGMWKIPPKKAYIMAINTPGGL